MELLTATRQKILDEKVNKNDSNFSKQYAKKTHFKNNIDKKIYNNH